MRKTIFSVDTLEIMINCVNITLGFQTFVTAFPILLHRMKEEMKHAFLAVSTIITVLAIVKTALKFFLYDVDFWASSLY